MRLQWALALAVGLAACGGDDDTGTDGGTGGDAGPGPARAEFAVPEDGAPAWRDIPFPHDLFRDADGRVRIAELQSTDPLWEVTRQQLEQRDGFCTTCSVYFPLAGSLDPTSIPSDAEPGDTPSLDDAVFMVDVDPDSPEAGRLIPVRVDYPARDAHVVVQPVRGVVLARERTYAVALTDQIRGADGSPLEPSDGFVAVRDGGTGPGVDRARAVMEPAFVALEDMGVERQHIVSLAVFTTWDPTREALALQGVVDAADTPAASLDRVWTGAQIDELFGTPAESRPGLDVPPAGGTEGDRAVVHETVGLVLTGRFEAPRVVEGEADAAAPGFPLRDEAGQPMAGPMQSVPFTLVVPEAADPTSLPVVIFHTGLGDSRQLGLVLADTLGRAGYAVLAVEPFLQGERAAGAGDTKHFLRESGSSSTLGPDGMVEADGAGVILRQLGLNLEDTGHSEELTGAPGFWLGTMEQQLADDLAAIRWVLAGDVSALADADPSLAGLSFDADHVAFFGGFPGAATGVLLEALVPTLSAVVLVYPPGSWVEMFTESPVGMDRYAFVYGGYFHLTGSFDGNERRLVVHPAWDLYRWVIEPVDPLAFAPVLFDAPLHDGHHPDLLVQLARYDEWVGPPTSEGLLTAAGIPGAGSFHHAQVETTTLPVSANVSTAGGDVTAAASQYEASHFAILDATDTRTVAEPIEPPFATMDPVEMAQPIEAMHAQIEAFLASSLSETHARVTEP